MLDYVPGRFQVIRHVRPKYACTRLRCDHPGPGTGDADTARSCHAGDAGASAGVEVLRPPAALPPERDLRPRGARSRPLDPVRLGWPGGLAARPDGRRRSAGTCSPPRRSMATTRRSRCWRRGSAGPGPDGSGSMSATTGRSAARRRRPLPTSSVPIAVASIRQRIWRTSPASCRPMVMPGSKRSTIAARSQATADHRSGLLGALPPQVLRCVGQRPNRRSPRRRSTASPRSMLIEDKARVCPGGRAGEHRDARRHRCSMRSLTGPRRSSRKLSAKSELAEAFRYTIKPARSAQPLPHRRTARGRQQHRRKRDAWSSRSEGKIISSPVRMQAASGQHRSTPFMATAKLNGLNPETYLQGHPGQDRRRASHQPHRRTDAVADDPPAATSPP